MKANPKNKNWQGLIIERGQLVTSLDSICHDTRFTKQVVRTCLKRLKSTQEITIKTTHRYSVITILKYNTYQTYSTETTTVNNTDNNTPLTHEQHTTNRITSYNVCYTKLLRELNL